MSAFRHLTEMFMVDQGPSAEPFPRSDSHGLSIDPLLGYGMLP